jgi:uncharacterized tellurite resistance protein B-like protein
MSTIEAVNSTVIEEDENTSLEELLLQSDLLAGMVRADGKVLDVENTVATEYFEQKNSEKSELVKSHYNYVIQDENTDARISTVMSFMSKLDREDKYKLLRCLSAVAVCDGHLDKKELDLIKQFAKAMDIDPNGI